MVRQVNQKKSSSDIKTRIVSLKYLNPYNKPDKWEEKSIREFEKGKKESFEITSHNGVETVRYMSPFFIEKGCLSCHANQGYKIGDIRGAISITFPITRFNETKSSIIFNFLLPRIFIWLSSMIGLWYGFIILSRIDKKRNSAENDLQKAFTHTEEEVQARTKELKAEVENRIKTENQLKAELHFSDILIDSIPGVLYLYDQQFNFLRWNKTFETVTKYSADEISKMKPLDFFPDSDKEAIGKKITMVFDNGFSEFEGNLILKSGEMIPFDFNNHRLIKGDKKYLLGIGINISEKKKNEAEIIKLNLDLEQKVEERTRKLQETNQKLGAYDYIVKRKNYLLQLPHAIENAIYRFRLNQTNNANQLKINELSHKLAEKLKQTDDEKSDIEKELKFSQEIYSELFYYNPTPIIVFNEYTLKIEDVNLKAISHYGYSREEFLSMSILDIRPEEEKASAEKVIKMSLEKGGIFQNYKHKKKSEEIIDVEVHAKSLPRLVDKKLTIAVVFDVTERNRNKELILEQLDELKRWQNVIIGREERNIELKQEVNDLLVKLGQNKKYFV